MPRKAHFEAARNQAMQPPRLELTAGQAIDVPGATPASCMKEVARLLGAEDRPIVRLAGREFDSHLGEGGLQPQTLGWSCDEFDAHTVRGVGVGELVGKADVSASRVVQVN
jgi:hypothetical protein